MTVGIQSASSRICKLGIIQVRADYSWPVKKCQDEMLELVERCLKDGADLVFMPEGYQYKSVKGTVSKSELVRAYAEDFKRRCGELARKYGSYVVPWDYEEEDGKIYNVSYVLDRQGEQIGKYRKVWVTRDEELGGLSPGDGGFPVFDLDFGKVGILICFDNYYGESARCLALAGAELLLYPLYGDTLKPQWEIKTRARAIDNMVYVAPCHIHSSPKEAGVTFTGLIGPDGDIMARLDQEGSHAVIEVDMGGRLITNTSARPGSHEDLKEFLMALRRPESLHSFRRLLEPMPRTKEWNEIRWSDDLR